LNRGWRFCRPLRNVNLAALSCVLVLSRSRFCLVFGPYCSRIALDSPPSGGPSSIARCGSKRGPENLLPPARNTAAACDDEQNSYGHVRQRVERADLTMRMICSWSGLVKPSSTARSAPNKRKGRQRRATSSCRFYSLRGRATILDLASVWADEESNRPSQS
jgi:hypothetical protein